MDGNTIRLENHEVSYDYDTEAQDSQNSQRRDNTTNSGVTANISEGTLCNTVCAGDGQHEYVLHIAPNDETKIINSSAVMDQRIYEPFLQEGQDNRSRISCANVSLTETQQSSQRFNGNGANADISEADNVLHGACRKRLSSSPCTLLRTPKKLNSPISEISNSPLSGRHRMCVEQQTPEKQQSPSSEVIDSPVSALRRMCVEMSVLTSPSHGQNQFSDSLAFQGLQNACSTPKSRTSIRKLAPSPNHNFEDNMITKIKEDDGNHDYLRAERDRLRNMIKKQKEEFLGKRRILEKQLAEGIDHSQEVKKQIPVKKDDPKRIMKEYEKTITALVEQREIRIEELAAMRERYQTEIESTKEHIGNLQAALMDLKSKYEKSRVAILNFEDCHEDSVRSIEAYKEELNENEQLYERLKHDSSKKLERYNEAWSTERQAQQADIIKLRAIIKKLELSISSNEVLIVQKVKENKKLTRLHREIRDELRGNISPGVFRLLDAEESDESGIHV